MEIYLLKKEGQFVGGTGFNNAVAGLGRSEFGQVAFCWDEERWLDLTQHCVCVCVCVCGACVCSCLYLCVCLRVPKRQNVARAEWEKRVSVRLATPEGQNVCLCVS